MKYELLKGWKILFLLAFMICLSSFNYSFMPCLPLSFTISSLPCSPLMASAPLGGLCPYPGCFSRPSHHYQFAAWVLTSGVLKWLFTCWCSSRAPLFVISAAESSGPSRHCLSSAPALFPLRLPWLSLWQPHSVWHLCLLLLPTAHLTAKVSGTFKSCKWSSYSCHPSLRWHQISRSLLLSSHPCL